MCGIRLWKITGLLPGWVHLSFSFIDGWLSDWFDCLFNLDGDSRAIESQKWLKIDLLLLVTGTRRGRTEGAGDDVLVLVQIILRYKMTQKHFSWKSEQYVFDYLCFDLLRLHHVVVHLDTLQDFRSGNEVTRHASPSGVSSCFTSSRSSHLVAGLVCRSHGHVIMSYFTMIIQFKWKTETNIYVWNTTVLEMCLTSSLRNL